MKKAHENTFAQGRELVKKLMAAALISGILGLVCDQLSHPVAPYILGLTVIIMATTIYVMVTYCRCPHCGKRILTGILVATTCPSCRRSLVTGKKVKKN